MHQRHQRQRQKQRCIRADGNDARRERKGERESERWMQEKERKARTDLMAPALRRKLDDIILAVLKKRESKKESKR